MFAKKFIEKFSKEFVFVNIDESLIMSNELVGRAWMHKKANRNIAVKQAFKSTAITAALTSKG